MANLIPSYDKILSLKVKPEEGEIIRKVAFKNYSFF